MEKIDALRSRLPDDARDLKLNLQSVLTNSSLEPRQRWGVALAVAHVHMCQLCCRTIDVIRHV